MDNLIKAQLPDPNDPRQTKLFKIVTTQMIHGPCGHLNPNSVCMENGKCTKDFPKNFQAETEFNVDGYPAYARPDNRVHFIKKINKRDVIVSIYIKIKIITKSNN